MVIRIWISHGPGYHSEGELKIPARIKTVGQLKKALGKSASVARSWSTAYDDSPSYSFPAADVALEAGAQYIISNHDEGKLGALRGYTKD